ncbi:MAG: aldehyde dehydrogenase family protein [Acidimicrobiia bacterium]
MTTTETTPATGTRAFCELVSGLRATFASGLTRPLAWRLEQLDAIVRLLRERETELLDALHADLGKPPIEGWASDIGFVVSQVHHMRRNLSRWLAQERVFLPLKLRPGQARVVREPLGVVLVIAPWNYPVHLLLLPMAGAIAAGNCVVGKPSEVTPTVSATLARLVPEYLDARAVAVVEGGVPETTTLLEERFDHIFYTGNGRVGRVVMAAAARHLTPVTLELGGKSPAIVHASADLASAARRIAWGKFLNAGQTCVAPDYVLVEESVERPLLRELVEAVRHFYGPEPAESPDFARIVSDAHVARLRRLLLAGGYDEIVTGGRIEPAERYVAPTLLRGVSPDAAVMAEEIFGPILPVLTVRDLAEAVQFVRGRERPLALYVFARDRAAIERVVAEVPAGGVCVNATVLHLSVPDLPFGGVGESGMGVYHGRYSIDTFSHRKSVFERPPRPDPAVMYPPYRRWKAALLRRFM